MYHSVGSSGCLPEAHAASTFGCLMAPLQHQCCPRIEPVRGRRDCHWRQRVLDVCSWDGSAFGGAGTTHRNGCPYPRTSEAAVTLGLSSPLWVVVYRHERRWTAKPAPELDVVLRKQRALALGWEIFLAVVSFDWGLHSEASSFVLVLGSPQDVPRSLEKVFGGKLSTSLESTRSIRRGEV